MCRNREGILEGDPAEIHAVIGFVPGNHEVERFDGRVRDLCIKRIRHQVGQGFPIRLPFPEDDPAGDVERGKNPEIAVRGGRFLGESDVKTLTAERGDLSEPLPERAEGRNFQVDRNIADPSQPGEGKVGKGSFRAKPEARQARNVPARPGPYP